MTSNENVTPEVLANRKAWVAALRGDRFKQGYSRLVTRTVDDQEFHCCLGVASVLACEAGVDLRMNWVGHPIDGEVAVFSWVDKDGSDRKERNYLPKPVQQEWLGLGTDCPVVGVLGRPLAFLNDDRTPFPEIADLIEAEWVTPHEAKGSER